MVTNQRGTSGRKTFKCQSAMEFERLRNRLENGGRIRGHELAGLANMSLIDIQHNMIGGEKLVAIYSLLVTTRVNDAPENLADLCQRLASTIASNTSDRAVRVALFNASLRNGHAEAALHFA